MSSTHLGQLPRLMLNGLRRLFILLLTLPILFYKGSISPLTPPSCRFTPSCSTYALEAIRRHGPIYGLYLALRRILRCHPWGGSGYDPVP
nr:membrane protein insertion efficiency factor YidD [uncultured Porphyromonas sp.]